MAKINFGQGIFYICVIRYLKITENGYSKDFMGG